MELSRENFESYPCLVCGSNDFTKLLDWVDRHRLPVSLSVCKKCGLRQLNPRMKDGELEQFYSSEYYKLYSMDKRAENAKWTKRKQGIANGILNAVEKHRPLRGLRLLDIGCGHGFLITEAKKRGAIVAGVEPSVKHATRLSEKGFDVFSGTLEQFVAEQREPYDIVTSSHVLEHSSNPGQFLKLASGLLAEDGLLCAEVPNADWQTIYGKHPVSIHTAHLAYHTDRSLRAQFETSGLNVLSMTYGLNGGSVRAVSVPGPTRKLEEMVLDDPSDIQNKTLRAFKKHTAPWPFKKFHYALRMVRKGIVKSRFKRAQKAELKR
jgi:2-polyprenyl-3-methyl-5-hydroxy-6-metoxy-1,4-benzoquinol methylase